jgi:hypothetical protein
MTGRRVWGALSALLGTAVLAACTSVGQVGIMTRPSADPGELLREAHAYREIGPAEGSACRYFLLAIIPWGDSTASRAFEKALETSGGDAMLNVTVYSSLYGFIPYWNVFSYTCTTVRGIAIAYAPEPPSAYPASPEPADASPPAPAYAPQPAPVYSPPPAS